MEKSGKILIIDDEKQNIKILTEFLREDYQIMAARNGENAFEIMEKEEKTLPDLVLLDILMPGMDGYEVIRRIKSNDRTKYLPVIFITALDATDDESRGFKLGAVDYITKPFKPEIVKARVRTHIQLKRKTDLLDRLASLDGLTQIPNRRKFDEILEKEVRILSRRRSNLSLILMDIDYFKAFNDNYGHMAGDECLRKVAKALADVAKRAGDFVARYGGEEFAMILPETDGKGAIQKAEQARCTVQELAIPHAFSDVSDRLSISLGLAAVSLGYEQGQTPKMLVELADKALYQAKEKGRNRFVAAVKDKQGETWTEWTENTGF